MFDTSPTASTTTNTHNHLVSSGLFTTLAVTLWTTLLIAYRIYSASRQNILNGSKPHFHRILEMFTQSAGIFAIILAMNAIMLAVPQNGSNIWTIFTAGNYMGVTLHVITVCQVEYPTLLESFLNILGYCTYAYGSSSCCCLKFCHGKGASNSWHFWYPVRRTERQFGCTRNSKPHYGFVRAIETTKVNVVLFQPH